MKKTRLILKNILGRKQFYKKGRRRGFKKKEKKNRIQWSSKGKIISFAIGKSAIRQIKKKNSH